MTFVITSRTVLIIVGLALPVMQATNCRPLWNKSRRHHAERTFARRNCVTLTLNQAVQVWRSWLSGKIVHLVVHENTGTFRYHSGTERVVQGIVFATALPCTSTTVK